ncbi:hypothetical protein A6F68_01140 [Tsuneonella dongtanensis]|uniref:UrcA family protein n=1 Tax=Tsuneonella dongtanensis TaxID=692370 RepID=A0A1B2AC37_9SPHN|nr:UrcA family protein [Tsuneonella dongtanensis]ANY19658.1 hypothetical protein A6F68_01140 [Tsuneonella dongtanensis]
MRTLRAVALPVIGGAFLMLSPGNAFAQTPEIVVSARMPVPEGHEAVKLVVGIEDFDLTTPAGAAGMEKRIGAVIKRFCAPPPRAQRWAVKDGKACSEYAWASARPQMDQAVKAARRM